MSYVPGLEGVVVGETAISHVEGEIGRLSYRGIPIERVIDMQYLEVAYLVLFGEQPDDTELAAFERFLSEHGALSEADLRITEQITSDLHPMNALQAVIPLLGIDRSVTFSVAGRDLDSEAIAGLQILAKYPAVLAAIRARRSDLADPRRYDPNLGYLERFMLMYTGEVPEPAAMATLKVVQLLQIDHSFNAGTFASRVISSTMAPVAAVLSGAVGALAGTLHGGADEAALNVARMVGDPENAETYVDKLLAEKGRLMGMGHREYRVVDPRAVILKPMAASICQGTAVEREYLTLLAIEEIFNQRMAEKGKDVWANVEYYKGVVLEALGIEAEFFTTMFAMARSVGYLAHFIESRAAGSKIIRPAAKYVGPVVSAV